MAPVGGTLESIAFSRWDQEVVDPRRRPVRWAQAAHHSRSLGQLRSHAGARAGRAEPGSA